MKETVRCTGGSLQKVGIIVLHREDLELAVTCE